MNGRWGTPCLSDDSPLINRVIVFATFQDSPAIEIHIPSKYYANFPLDKQPLFPYTPHNFPKKPGICASTWFLTVSFDNCG